MPTAKKQRVLILSASAGNGHVRAADALLKDFQAHPNVSEVQHWDFLQYTNAVFRTIYSKLYMDLINRAPWVLGMAYKATDKPWKNTAAQAFEKFSAGPFVEALRAYAPDVIVCTHFTPPNVLAWLNEKKGTSLKGKIPLPAIVVTDLDCHAMWLTRSYSRYFVMLEETEIYLQRMGIAPEKITRSGIPIDPIFRIPVQKTAARAALGLHPTLPTLLISAGGLGADATETLLLELQQIQTPTQLIVIAGRSEPLKRKLDKIAQKLSQNPKPKTPQSSVISPPPSPLTPHIIGFTTQMHDYMAAADLLITKPGGLTIAEAMARSLPLCIVNPIPGQEERNADHLLEAGTAIKCNNPPTIGWKLERLLADAPEWKRCRQRRKPWENQRRDEQ